MRTLFRISILSCFFLFSCDPDRVYEQNLDFEDRLWPVASIAEFDFAIDNDTTSYNVYYNVRNSNEYPYARIFVTYYLIDSTGTELQKKLISNFLFDQKTGKPLGSSGVGDIYDHRFVLIEKYKFQNTGNYKMKLEHYMRTGDLEGILSIGLRVEKAK